MRTFTRMLTCNMCTRVYWKVKRDNYMSMLLDLIRTSGFVFANYYNYIIYIYIYIYIYLTIHWKQLNRTLYYQCSSTMDKREEIPQRCYSTVRTLSGAAIWGVGGVRTPPIIWMGGLNPLNNIDIKLNKILIKNLNIYYIHIYNIVIRKYVYTYI